MVAACTLVGCGWSRSARPSGALEDDLVLIEDPVMEGEVSWSEETGGWIIVPPTASTKADIGSDGLYYKLTSCQGWYDTEKISRKRILRADSFIVTMYDPMRGETVGEIDLAPILAEHPGYAFLSTRIYAWRIDGERCLAVSVLDVGGSAEEDVLLIRLDGPDDGPGSEIVPAGELPACEHPENVTVITP